MVEHHPPVGKVRWKRFRWVLGFVVLVVFGIWTVPLGAWAMFFAVLGPYIDGETERLEWWMAVPFGVLALLVQLGVAFGLVMCWRGFRPKRVPAY